MNQDCIFCKIASGQIGELIWQNDVAVAFYDIAPKAPIHIIVVPKQHYANLVEAAPGQAFLGQFMSAAVEVARNLGIDRAFRYHINNGKEAGQEVEHLHAHLLASKPGELMDKDRLHAAGL